MRSRLPLALLAALVVFAVPAGSALATAGAFTAPVGGATISQGQTFTVDTNGVAGATQVLFYDEETDPISGVTSTRFEGSGTETSPGSGIYTWQAQVGGWTNPTTGDNTPYGITFDAVVADVSGNAITTLYKTVTIANDVDPLTVAAVAPAADSTVSGTFTLSVTPSDPNNTVTSGDYSIQGGGTGTLVSDGSGHFTASVNTVADGIPNGDVYIDVHLMDAPGNQGDNSDNILHLVVANPQAPVITPGTLVANKALYRTAETQLEVGDKVQAYGMQADGYPAPVIHYLWNLCRGQVCDGVTPGQDGLYTIQPADEGATLTLVATASNASGTDFTTVGFDLIGPAYVDPSGDPFVDPAPEPVVTPPVVTPPVVAPPVVTPPVVTPPVDTTVITPAEQRALTVSQKGVTADTKAAVTAVEAKMAAQQAAVVATKKADAAVNKVAAANATATEKKQVVSSVTSLIDARAAVAKKMAAAKAAAVKAAEDRDAAERAAALAASKLVVAKKQAATGTTTTAEKKAVAAASQQAADAKAAAAAKKAAADAAAAKKAAGEAAAAKQIAVAGKKVDTAITVVSAGTATAADKKQVVETVTSSVVAKTVAADKSDAAAEAVKKLGAAKKKFAAQQAAAVK